MATTKFTDQIRLLTDSQANIADNDITWYNFDFRAGRAQITFAGSAFASATVTLKMQDPSGNIISVKDVNGNAVSATANGAAVIELPYGTLIGVGQASTSGTSHIDAYAIQLKEMR